jgi:hypothetical protein
LDFEKPLGLRMRLAEDKNLVPLICDEPLKSRPVKKRRKCRKPEQSKVGIEGVSDDTRPLGAATAGLSGVEAMLFHAALALVVLAIRPAAPPRLTTPARAGSIP